jgi:hypothetical protein
MANELITPQFLVESGVKALGLLTAGVRFTRLKELGASMQQIEQLGFDALHLVDSSLCADATAAYGTAAVKQTFAKSPPDAVALAGTESAIFLGLQPQELITLCAGAPVEAAAVLKQLRAVSMGGLEQFTATSVLDTGLREAQLKALGYGFADTSKLRGISKAHIAKLGFKL